MTWEGIQKITAEERIRRQFEDFFYYKYKVYPEQNIQVKDAIDTFVEMEKHLVRQIEVYKNYIEEYCNKAIPTTYIDKRKDL